MGSVAHPPLNAPTGFFTATGATTSCLSKDDVWNERVGVCAAKVRELDARRDESILDAIVGFCAETSERTKSFGETISIVVWM